MTTASVLPPEEVITLEEVHDTIRQFIESKFSEPIACSRFERHGRNKDYSPLNLYRDKKGIYRFVGPENETLYVGTAGSGDVQRLKGRVTQNFTGSTGATFIKNLVRDRPDLFNVSNNTPEKAHKEAVKWVLKHTSVQLAVTPDTEREHIELEKIAIIVFKSKHNRTNE